MRSWRPGDRITPNQINNVLGFPYIFRGALDVQARTINEPMKIAAAHAIAELARADVPDAVAKVYGRRLRYGTDYIIPAPFDPRLISAIPPAVTKAAMDSGVARRPIIDMEGYKSRLSARLDPAGGFINSIFDALRMRPKRVVFAEGEEEQVVRAACFVRRPEAWPPDPDRARGAECGMPSTWAGLTISKSFWTSSMPPNRTTAKDYAEFLYQRLQQQGLSLPRLRAPREQRPQYLRRLHARSSAMPMPWSPASPAIGRQRSTGVQRVLDPKPGRQVIGISVIISRGRVVFVADTSVHEMPTSEQLAGIAVEAGGRGLALRHYAARSHAGLFHLRPSAGRERAEREPRGRQAARAICTSISSTTARWGRMSRWNRRAMALYPFCRLTDTANVLIMPAIPRRQHFGKNAARTRRRHGDRPHAGRLVEARPDCLARLDRQGPREHGRARRLRCNRIAEPRDAAPGRLEKAYPPIAREGGRRGAVGNAPRTAADAPCFRGCTVNLTPGPT